MDLAAQGNSKYRVPTDFCRDIFRVYDIRGVTGEKGLTPDLAYAIGLAIGSEARELNQTEIIVGRDARLTGPVMAEATIQGLRDAGMNVIFIGIVPTTLVYFATHRLSTNSGVMITASHNPRDDNGFKIVLDGKTLSSDRIQALLQRIVDQRFTSGSGELTEVDVLEDYIQYVAGHVQLKRPLKVVVDAGNGAGSELAPRLYRALGSEVIELYCEFDGHFPNHHPDPTVPGNLDDLIAAVKAHHADLGLAFDGDADRVGVVTNKGEVVWPDRQMMLYSIDLLSRQPGADILFDVKCSRNLPKVIKAHGGQPLMWCTGHSILKAKLLETKAPLAGEMSGHIFFNDEWFGFDDGLYVGARLMRILAADSRSCSERFLELPDSVNTPELKLPMPEERKQSFMEALKEHADFGESEVVTIDGLRVECAKGWGLIRPSNTSPYLILRFEADTDAELARIKALFRTQLLNIDADLSLPF